MATRWGVGWIETGDTLDPSQYVQDMGIIAGEFDGALDRDNLPSATIAATEIDASVSHVFNDAALNSPTDTAFTAPDLDVTITDWQGGSGTTTGATCLGIKTWTATQDGHYDIAWSGEWIWSGAWSYATNGSARPDTIFTFDTVAFRIVVDGIIIAQSQPFDDSAEYWNTDLECSIQLPAGTHTCNIQMKIEKLEAQTGFSAGTATNTPTPSQRALAILARYR